MAQLAEGMGEVSYVDPLAAAMRMAAVAEQPDAQGPIVQWIRHRCIIPLAFFGMASVIGPYVHRQAINGQGFKIVRKYVDLGEQQTVVLP
jgi:hypothetical protein